MKMEKITHHEGTGHNRPFPTPFPFWKSRQFYNFLAMSIAICVAIRFLVGE